MRREGDTERIIGSWLAKGKGRREKVVLASKITGGRNVNARNIKADFEDSLKRLGTDYLDLYLLHWPARYSPQANWGQSLEYKRGMEAFIPPSASFEEIATAMGALVKEGKLRGWGSESSRTLAPRPHLTITRMHTQTYTSPCPSSYPYA